jgi:aminoglycoside phosphotransferase (APT) family kinase protein
MTSALRAHAALRAAGLAGAGPVRRAVNSHNEIWFAGPYVVRVDPNPRSRRLQHEVRVLGRLPAEVPAAPVFGHGREQFGEWLVVGRVDGSELSRAWPTMTVEQRERAVTAVGRAMAAIHSVDAVAGRLDEGLPDDPMACPHQLPAERLAERLGEAARLPFVDRGMIEAAVVQLATKASALDRHPRSLVHGDLHFENVLWNGHDVTAIVDFEWARPGPRDLDLDVLLHALADPSVHVGRDYDVVPQRYDFDRVAGWLRASYPALFEHPRLDERLWIYRLSYDTRALLLDPPSDRLERLSPHHPYQRLHRLVEGRSDLGWVLSD